MNHGSAEQNFSDPAEQKHLFHTIEAILENKSLPLPRAEKIRLTQEIYNNVAGLGALQPLLDDPEVTEIMVNGPANVYVERHGKLELTGLIFRNNDEVMNIINRIVSSVGRRIDESSPMVDARLADGSRVNAIIPPLALNGPTITIRKFSKSP
jgi:pilus assembly protein CpaF